MEVASQRELLNFKIKHLRDQRQNLQVVLDDHIEKIVSIGQAWLDGKREDNSGKTLSFREISLLMEDTAFLMVEKCQDLRGDGEVSTRSSHDSSPVTSLETVPNVQVPSDTCKSMLTRIQVLEEAISSLSTSTRKLSENQSQTNTFMENVTTKQSEMNEQQKRSSKETEEHLKQLIYKQTKTDTEQNQQFESLQHQLHTLEKAHSEMKEEILRSNKTTKLEASVESLKREVNKQKEDFHSLKVCVDEKLMKKVEDLAQKVTKQEKAGKKFDKVGQKLEELEEFGKQNLGKISAVEKKVERQKINLENFQAVERQREKALESVKEKIEQLEASSMSLAGRAEDQELEIQEVTETLERHSDTLENQKSSLQQLTTIKESHTVTLQGYSIDRERQIERMREVEDRLTVLETEKTEALEEVGKQFADVKQKYEMVCEMVDDRVLPLERLREILNGKIKGREENVEKLHEVIKEVADLVPKVSQLKKDLATPAVAVTAQSKDTKLVIGKILKSWACLSGNIGGHFDVNTGMFKAPHDGVYGVCLTMFQQGEGEISLRVYKTFLGYSPDTKSSTLVTETITNNADCGDNDFSLVNMAAGDRLYVYVNLFSQGATLCVSRFSVFRVK